MQNPCQKQRTSERDPFKDAIEFQRFSPEHYQDRETRQEVAIILVLSLLNLPTFEKCEAKYYKVLKIFAVWALRKALEATHKQGWPIDDMRGKPAEKLLEYVKAISLYGDIGLYDYKETLDAIQFVVKSAATASSYRKSSERERYYADRLLFLQATHPLIHLPDPGVRNILAMPGAKSQRILAVCS